ncbi:MAG TPA: response regulator [Cyanobacteria bacterium UBA8803]|nr:response regulator [Cyanobacteria bacterium UBA9273]HBL62219.1 response regulator [Cyanobacteria bacterium UBA8803]
MSSYDGLKTIDILLVEDSKSDAHLTIETLSESRILNQLHWVKDGAEAIDFLYKQGQYHEAPRPDLIVLDLNLPKKNGREVLAQIKSDENLKTIPVVILTTSVAEQDILKSYRLQANCYLVKPVDLDRFIAVIKSIENFWLTAVKFPPSED